MLHRRVPLVLLMAAAVLSPAVSADAPTVVSADRFVDSVGMNVHLHYDNTPYRTLFPLIKARLLELGVRHVRDGLIDTTWMPYYQRHNELGQAGIKGAFITSPEQSAALWASYPARLASSFEAFEGPNEFDQTQRTDWVPVLTDAVRRLYGVKGDPRAANFAIYGPSLTAEDSYGQVGNLAPYMDYANLHNYFGGRHPATKGWGPNGYGSIPWSLALAAEYAPGRPVVTTETGYQDDPSALHALPQDIISRYFPILLMEQYRAGIVRTYIYELCDFPKSGSFGLLNQDGSPKPAFTAVKNLLNLLADPGPAVTPQPLQYVVGSHTGDARDLALQKRDGTYFIALWLVRQSYDQNTRRRVTVQPQTVTVTVPAGPLRYSRAHQWQTDGTVTTTGWTPIAQPVSVLVADRLTIVELSPQTPPSPPENLRRVPNGSER